jgi:hypothetical protein
MASGAGKGQGGNGVGERAWREFLGALADAAKTITGPTGAANALERAEGFRYLTRLIGAGLEMHLERADPARPTFTRMLSPIRKFLGDNPDVLYEVVPLEGARRYRVRGRRGSELYLAFCVYERTPEGATVLGANLSDAQMRFEPDGSFELELAAEQPAGARNWLALGPRAASMIARQYFHDPATATPARLEIEAIPAAGPPEPLTEAALAERLAAVAHFVRETSELSAALSVFAGLNPAPRGGEPEHVALQVVGGVVQAERPSARELVAQLDPKLVAGHLPTPDIAYTGAWWRIGPDEAVVAEGTPPRCRYWSLQIFNRWLESPDYRYRRVALNDSQMQLEADGSFRVVIAARDPGARNWIDTAGHEEGQGVFRALLAEKPPVVRFRIVKLDSLR